MTIAIIDYRAGNVTSVARALRHLGEESVITYDAQTILSARRVIFPGVGAAASCMQALAEHGCDDTLRTVAERGLPLLGICVGMQLLFSRSEEDGGVDCLGIIPGQVRKFPTRPGLKVPHMGWNQVTWNNDQLAPAQPAPGYFYFVHSYYCDPDPTVTTIAESEHGQPFCAGVRHGNVAAVQFHPEKSGPLGLQVLRQFIDQGP